MNEKRKETLTDTERKEIGILSTMGFDSATSSFLALLANRSHVKKKQKKGKTKKTFQLRSKKVNTIFCLESSSNPSPKVFFGQ